MPSTKWPMKFSPQAGLSSANRPPLACRPPGQPPSSHLPHPFKVLLPGKVGSQRIPGHREGNGLPHSVWKWVLPSLQRCLKCPMGLATLCTICLKSCYRLDLDCSWKADRLKYLVYLAIWESGELQVGPSGSFWATGGRKAPKGISGAAVLLLFHVPAMKQMAVSQAPIRAADQGLKPPTLWDKIKFVSS